MSPELGQLIPLAAILLCGMFLGVTLERLLSTSRRRAWRERNRWNWEQKRQKPPSVDGTVTSMTVLPASRQFSAADQLRIVMSAPFTIQPLLNRSEMRVFKELDRMVIERNSGWQVMAQVSVGEIVRSPSVEAYSCVNSKRVDLLLVDENCQPRHALEYQGRAHHQGTAAARDAIKKEALRRAGIGYHEIVGGHTTPAELRRLVEKLVEKARTDQ